MAENKAKLILNVRSSQFGNFKISFPSDGTATFKDLVQFIVQRLQTQGHLTKSADSYTLTDNSSFEYLSSDLVSDFCDQNSELILSEVFIKIPVFPTVHSKAQDFQTQPLKQQQQQQTIASPPAQIIPTPTKIIDQPKPTTPKNNQNQQQQPKDNDELYSKLYQSGKMSKCEEVKEMTEQYMEKSFLIPLSNNLEQLLAKSMEESKIQEKAMIKIQMQFPQLLDSLHRYSFIVEKKWKLRELSDHLLNSLKLINENYRIVLFTERGAPFHHNLQMLNEIKCEEILENGDVVFVLFVRADNDNPEYPDLPANEGPSQIFAKYDGKTYTINIDLENTNVLQLKQKVQQKLKIQVSLQSIFYAGKYLVNEKLIKEYGIMKESNLEVNVSMSAQSVGDSGDNYYNPSLRLLKLQSEEGMRQFRSHLMALTKQESTDEFKITILAVLRELSNNNAPLVAAMKDLFDNRKLTMVQKLALEESYYSLFTKLLFEKCKYVPTMLSDLPSNLFEHSRVFFSIILHNAKELLSTYKEQWIQREKFIQLDMTCSISLKSITNPVFLIQDGGKQLVVEKSEIEKIIKEGKSVEGVQSFSKEKNLKELQKDMQKVYKLQKFFKAEQQFIQWTPVKDEDLTQFSPIDSNKFKQNEIEWDTLINEIQTKDEYLPIKIYKPMELKGKHELHLLTLNKDKKLNLYSGISKGVSSPLELYDVITGRTTTEGAENIAQNQSASHYSNNYKGDQINVAQVQLEEVISIEPKEAIVVLIVKFIKFYLFVKDTSSSMNSVHFNKTISRIGAVKAFFKAFSDRTIAYNFRHVISLVTFDYQATLVCNFTEIFTQFANYVEQLAPQGMTLLFDSISFACDKLLELKKKYPNCILRILALTDGEDNRSKQSSEAVAQKIYNNNIIIDSFVVGDNCNDLKSITLANGGNCFYPSSLSDAMKLFEAETVLSVGIRKKKKKPEENVTTASLNEFKKKPFTESWDPIETPHEFSLPACNLNQTSIQDIMKEENKQIQSNLSMKRIIREIQNYQVNQNPRIQIFPCRENLTFWKVVIIGPPSTPYHKGLFILYVQFNEKYPVEPPNIRFITPIYHCNINAHGRICHRVLDRDYTQDTTMKTILDCIYGLLLHPEPEDPLDMTIAMEFLSENEYDMYVYNATTKTQQFAQRPLNLVVDDIFNPKQVMNDIDIQIKIQEFQKWAETVIEMEDEGQKTQQVESVKEQQK